MPVFIISGREQLPRTEGAQLRAQGQLQEEAVMHWGNYGYGMGYGWGMGFHDHIPDIDHTVRRLFG